MHQSQFKNITKCEHIVPLWWLQLCISHLSNSKPGQQCSQANLCQYMRRPAFLQQLMLSCENECTLSALCTKAHARKFPVFTVSKAMPHSGGHLVYYFTYSFTTKRGVLVFHVMLWRSFLTKAQQEGIVPLSQGYFPVKKMQVFISLGVKQEKAK